MRACRRGFAPGVIAFGLTGPALAAEPPAPALPDSAMIAALPDSAMIIVTAPALPGRVLSPGVTIGAEALLDRQPRSLGDALRGLPGVTVRTNSRGETIPRIRGSDERQTQVFLDGAPLVVPWDGRIDIGLIPAGLIGGVSVRKGAVPIEYGANAIAGVIDLTSRRDGFAGVIQAGAPGLINASAAAGMSWRGLDLTLGAAHQAQDALRVAEPAALPFNQAPGRRRTNSDSAATSLYGAIGGRLGPLLLRGSILHFHATRGIAPEGDRAAARFWRYPDIDFTQAQLTAEIGGNDTRLRLTAWRQWFGQTIMSFPDASYRQPQAREDNDDDTLGARLTLTQALGTATLRLSASASDSEHRQRDTALPGGAAPDLRFRQRLFSLGLEADLPLGRATRLTLGGGYDHSRTPATGDKPAQAASAAPVVSLALAHDVDDRLRLTLSGGRRTRFVSLREAFGEALGRFLANPALRPETAWLADLALTWRQPGRRGASLTINPFLIRAQDNIGQRVVDVAGRPLRQRVNQGGASSFGVDVLALLPFAPGWTAELTGSLLHAATDAGTALPQRPAHDAMLAIDWAPNSVLDTRVELRHIGPAHDIAADGRPLRLPPATQLNLRARITLARLGTAASAPRLALTAAIDNATDALILPQAGLPDPGRTLRIGVLVTG